MRNCEFEIGDIVKCTCGCGNIYEVTEFSNDDPAGVLASVTKLDDTTVYGPAGVDDHIFLDDLTLYAFPMRLV